ncbi:hypothetical protein DBV15_04618 [Temnothorax longispinosus]|uniref:Uncharacterized protein n=1 Tax=Temnothorax longispinosus TaxID=300112 RepID=A0A4S2KWP2_9HYME|nr:hypothetical protein DBV15_04618 [Temnothorax longispinosus]
MDRSFSRSLFRYSSGYYISSSHSNERRAKMYQPNREPLVRYVSFFNRVNINRYRHCIVKVTAHSKEKIKPDCVGASSIVARHRETIVHERNR